MLLSPFAHQFSEKYSERKRQPSPSSRSLSTLRLKGKASIATMAGQADRIGGRSENWRQGKGKASKEALSEGFGLSPVIWSPGLGFGVLHDRRRATTSSPASSVGPTPPSKGLRLPMQESSPKGSRHRPFPTGMEKVSKTLSVQPRTQR